MKKLLSPGDCFEAGQVIREYKHELNREVRSISGGYELEREGKFEIHGREVLFVVGNAVVDSSCCGVWGCRYALVPGYVKKFKTRQDDHGLWISEVEPIIDKATRQEIIRLLKEKEIVQQVQFS
ncbi:MAG: hypothetical protein ISS59_01275 [Desulfobacteraceae bacterium]|nr:hypothetical protein [Desulfobacteraceae bacterium]